MGKRTLSHEILMKRMRGSKTWDVLCVQEPHLTKRGLSGLRDTHEAFWLTTSGDIKDVRSLVIARKSLRVIMITERSREDLVAVRVGDLVIVSIYCRREKSVVENWSGIEELRRDEKDLVICGDLNAHSYRWGEQKERKRSEVEKQKGTQIEALMDEWGLNVMNQIPHKATYNVVNRESWVDVTIVTRSLTGKVKDWRIDDEGIDSDHELITFQIGGTSLICDNLDLEERLSSIKRRIGKQSEGGCLRLIKQKLWENRECCKRKIKSIGGVDRFMGWLRDIITDTMQEEARREVARHRNMERAEVWWWTKKVAGSHQSFIKAKRRWKKYKVDELKQIYNDARNEFRRSVREAKSEKWKELVDRESDPWSKLMKIARLTDSGRSMCRTMKTANGLVLRDVNEVLCEMEKQFFPKLEAKTFWQLEIESEVRRWLEESVEWCTEQRVSRNELRIAVKEMPLKKAAGDDFITNEILKGVLQIGDIEERFVECADVCLSKGYVMQDWKRARVVTIPKPGVLADTVKAFRPISLTSTVGKLIERVVVRRLTDEVERLGRMSNMQHAYRRNGSTQTAIYDFMEYVETAKREGMICVAAFMDISGAFDRTWHEGILYQMKQMGISTWLGKWARSYLKEREAVIQYGGKDRRIWLEQGCPQGGVVSPILWNIFFNEMLQIGDKGDSYYGTSKVRTIGYADDAVILCRSKKMKSAAGILTRHMTKVKEWANKYKVTFNSKKLAVMVFNRGVSSAPCEVKFAGENIEEVEEYKYLGLVLDKSLLWGKHIARVQRKLDMATGMIYNLGGRSSILKYEHMKILLHGVLLPIMTYGIVIWGWRALLGKHEKVFDQLIGRFCAKGMGCMRATARAFVKTGMDVIPFRLIVHQQVRRVSVLQFNLTQVEKAVWYERREGKKQILEMKELIWRSWKGIREELQYIDMPKLGELYPDIVGGIKRKGVVALSRSQALWDGGERIGWRIFTNASRRVGGIGWSVVAYFQGKVIDIRKGCCRDGSIMTGEIRAVSEAIDYVREKEIKVRCTIYTDNKGVVIALQEGRSKRTDYRGILKYLEEMNERGFKLRIRWIPGHGGNYGNEVAHTVASQQVQEVKGDERGTLRDIEKRIREEEEKEKDIWWGKEITGLSSLVFVNRRDMVKYIGGWPGRGTIQILSGHCMLYDYLYKIGKRSNGECSCGKGRETLMHYLDECEKYNDIRKEVWGESGALVGIRMNKGTLRTYVQRTERLWKGIGRNL